jgi:hypothetical protein
MTRFPIASPIHQSDQSHAKDDQGWMRLMQRLVTPSVALTVVLIPAAKTIRPRTSRSRSSELRNPSCRSTQPPTSASSVFPAAIATAVPRGSCAVALASNAPSAMAGQTAGPRRTTAASAIPVGGQTVVTCSATKAIVSPSLAAPK